MNHRKSKKTIVIMKCLIQRAEELKEVLEYNFVDVVSGAVSVSEFIEKNIPLDLRGEVEDLEDILKEGVNEWESYVIDREGANEEQDKCLDSIQDECLYNLMSRIFTIAEDGEVEAIIRKIEDSDINVELKNEGGIVSDTGNKFPKEDDFEFFSVDQYSIGGEIETLNFWTLYVNVSAWCEYSSCEGGDHDERVVEMTHEGEFEVVNMSLERESVEILMTEAQKKKIIESIVKTATWE